MCQLDHLKFTQLPRKKGSLPTDRLPLGIQCNPKPQHQMQSRKGHSESRFLTPRAARAPWVDFLQRDSVLDDKLPKEWLGSGDGNHPLSCCLCDPQGRGKSSTFLFLMEQVLGSKIAFPLSDPHESISLITPAFRFSCEHSPFTC